MAKRLLQGIILVLLGLAPCSAQDQVMSSAGHHGRSSEVVLTWSVGEVVIATWSGQDCRLTNGFHQGEMEYAAEEIPDATIAMYPNPVRDQFTVALIGYEHTDLTAVLYNIQGARLREQQLLGGINLMSLEDIRPGLIICRVYGAGSEVIKTEKIIKF